MIRYDTRLRTLAVALSALAGYVDALGFVETGGFFVSFMSGNSTRLGVGLGSSGVAALAASGLIAMFVGGVTLGALVGRRAADARLPAVLFLVAVLLAVAAGLDAFATGWLALAVAAMAMGAENVTLESNGEVRVGLTYMTGTLVKLGQRIADALSGGDRLAWMPYLVHWLGLIAGATAGTLAHPYVGLSGLWAAAGAAAIIAVGAWRHRLYARTSETNA